MLAKVITQKKAYTTAEDLVDYVTEPDQERANELFSEASLSSDARTLLDYAARDGVVEAGTSARLQALDLMDPLDPQQKRLITKLFDHTVAQVRASGAAAEHPLYHVVVTWQPGERPSAAQAREAVAHTLAAVGLKNAAAMWVIHRDTEHHHVHIVALKYDIDTLKYLGPPKNDFLRLDKAMREIELAQGWAHSPGPYEVRNGRIVRSHERREKLSSPEATVERATGLPGIAAFAQAHGLVAKMQAAQDWAEMHALLSQAGLSIEPKRTGFVVRGQGITQEHVLKVSALHPSLAGPKLIERLGPYQPPAGMIVAVPAVRMTFHTYQERAARGIEPDAGEQPGRTGKRDPQKREAQRLARQRAREALYEAYRDFRASAPAQRKQALAELKELQREERKALYAAFRQQRAADYDALKEQFGKHIAGLVLAASEAKAKAALDEKHKHEKRMLRAQYPTSWREWLQMRAELHNDPAAIAALRGIRYREQRKRSKDRPGIEGEDLRLAFTPLPPDGAWGGIEGEPKRWSMADAQIEVSDDKTAVVVKDGEGKERFRDYGQRIELADPLDDEAMIAALDIAADRYGGEVFITGDEHFKQRAAKLCRERGIAIANPELRYDPDKTLENQQNRDKLSPQL